jgi:signal transduction histidine kinase
MLGGVASGVARWMGMDPTLVRLGFVLAAIFSGFGIAVYIVMWLILPADGDTESIASRAVHDWRGIVLALSLVPLVVLTVALGTALGIGWVSGLAVPVGIGAGGAILLWRNVGSEERRMVAPLVRPLDRLGLTGRGSWRTLLVRAFVGLVLVGGGAYLLSSNHATLRPLEGVGLVVAGAVVVFGPWWLRVARDLVDERQGRALAEERADMAARLHDSVLQTLALIQRRSDQPGQVVKLARAQERELRSWLFDGRAPGGAEDDDVMLSEAVHRIEREVEDLHEVAVDAVVVGDCGLDDELRSLVAAGREATVNAAKWSGAPVVSLFVEVEPDEVSMFVRDKGVGFDLENVGPDRRGVAQSILARVERHGGRAEVRSAPGDGTEVGLHMPRRQKR